MAKRRLPQDWSKCVICQEDKGEKLECPANSKRHDKGQGYVTFIEHLNAFNSIAKADEQFDFSHIVTETTDIVEHLAENRACWHKSCRSKFTATKLRRLEKKKELDLQFTSGPSCSTASDDISTPSSQTRRQSNRQLSQNKLEHNRVTCIFCNNAENGTLHAVCTKEIDSKIRTMASLLQDVDLMTFLADGDLIAQEAHYHKLCYTRYFNRTRQQEQTITPDNDENPNIESSIVFAEIVSFLEENIDVVHKLSDLIRMYKQECARRGLNEEYVHPSRFKDRLLRVIPDLDSYASGRETLLSFNKNISALLGKSRRETADDAAVSMWHAAKLIRKDLDNFDIPTTDLSLGCQESAVPKSLLTLMKMLLVGSSSVDSLSKRYQESLTLSQLVVTNYVQRKGRETTSKRILAARETPLPLYLGVFLYSNTRSRKIIDTLFSLGLSVSYNRVLSVSADIAAAVERRFEEDGVVCPVKLKHDIFTSAAVDNIDYNPTSTSSKTSFHGTGISLFQHPQHDEDGRQRPALQIASKGDDEPTVLKDFITVESEIPFGSKPALPHLCCHIDFNGDRPNFESSLSEEMQWLQAIASSDPETEVPTWPAYHSQLHGTNTIHPPSINTILPLLENAANKMTTIRHVMDNLQQTIHFLNPRQKPVLVADQPLFALAKQIQWKWPELYGEDKFVILMGGLHIEMEFFKSLGTLLGGTGWTFALSKAGICGAGTADSFLKACHIKRTRYAHQLTAACLEVLKYEAFVSSMEESDEQITIEEWCKRRAATSHQFFFWNLVQRLEVITFCLIKSFRAGNFGSYVETLREFLPFLFALNKTNYARWLPVHIRDMTALPITAPEVYEQFTVGHFSVRKSRRPFSAMSIDQAHEQNNETLKGSLNVISLMETPTTLQRWMLAVPHFASMMSEFESRLPGHVEKENDRHADDSLAKQKMFSKDVRKLVDVFTTVGNPFLEVSGDAICNLETGEIAGEGIHQSLRGLEAAGKMLCDEFIDQRFHKKTVMVTDPLKKSKVKLMSSDGGKKPSIKKATFKELKDTCGLFSQLYIACQRRGGDLDEFFAHENTTHPPALSSGGQLRTSENKSQLVPCLMAEVQHEDVASAPPSSCIIFDGAAMVQMTNPGGLITFKEYAQVFVKRLIGFSTASSRLDLVFDEYHQYSLKTTARSKRGLAGIRKVALDMMVPRNWREFLRNDQNKTELFRLLAKVFVESVDDRTVVSTCGPGVVSNTLISNDISPCHQEEADSRMMLHAAEAVRKGHKNITIRSVDTDVVILATALFSKIQAEELWIAFGTGKGFRYLPTHEITRSLGPSKTDSLLYFHAFTGCDTVSTFHGVGKRKAWSTWMQFPEVTNVFCALSSAPTEISDQQRQVLEHFTVQMYDKSCGCVDVNMARKILFAQKGRAIDRIPPTSQALYQHMKRAAYQAGHVWALCINNDAALPSPLDWGWKKDDGKLCPFWTDIAEASKACKELVKCLCKNGCKGSRCRCLRASLPCTDLCKCGGSCRA